MQAFEWKVHDGGKQAKKSMLTSHARLWVRAPGQSHIQNQPAGGSTEHGEDPPSDLELFLCSYTWLYLLLSRANMNMGVPGDVGGMTSRGRVWLANIFPFVSLMCLLSTAGNRFLKTDMKHVSVLFGPANPHSWHTDSTDHIF